VNAFIQVTYGPSGYRVEKWVWNSEIGTYMLDETHPKRFTHRYQADEQAISWANAEGIRFMS
jgi:hypothetical protein